MNARCESALVGSVRFSGAVRGAARVGRGSPRLGKHGAEQIEIGADRVGSGGEAHREALRQKARGRVTRGVEAAAIAARASPKALAVRGRQ